MTGTPEPKTTISGLRRILVTSDLTAYSDRTFDRAVLLAEENGASLCLLSVVDPNLVPDMYVRRDIRDAQAQLEHELRDSGADQRLDATVKVATGDPARAVLEHAQAMPAALIAMGLSHASLAGVFRGSTADRVVRRARCPVLVVKTRARRSYARIAAAVDLAEPSRQALSLALRLFPAARFTILHVDDTPAADPGAGQARPSSGPDRRSQIEAMVAASFAALAGAVPGSPDGPELLVGSGKTVDVLQEQVPRLRPDLVVLGTHGRTGVPGLFLGSVAETLLEVLPCDMLVARA